MSLSGFSVLREYFNAFDGEGNKNSVLFDLVQLSPSASLSIAGGNQRQHAMLTSGQDLPTSVDSFASQARFPILRLVTSLQAFDSSSSLTAATSSPWALLLTTAASCPLAASQPLTALVCSLHSAPRYLHAISDLTQRRGGEARSCSAESTTRPISLEARQAPQQQQVPVAVTKTVENSQHQQAQPPRGPSRYGGIKAVAQIAPDKSLVKGLVLAAALRPRSAAPQVITPPAPTAEKPLVKQQAAEDARHRAAPFDATSAASVAQLSRNDSLLRQLASVSSAKSTAAAAADAPTIGVTGKADKKNAVPPTAPRAAADPRPISLRPSKHTSSPFIYHSRCSGGALGYVFNFTMALEANHPSLLAILMTSASAAPRDVVAARQATIDAVTTGQSIVARQKSPEQVSPARNQQLFFGLRALHDAIGLIKFTSPIPIYTRVVEDSAWALATRKDVLQLAAAVGVAAESSLPPLQQHLPPVRTAQDATKSPQHLISEIPDRVIPARPKGTAQRIRRRMEQLQCEINELKRAHDERLARNMKETLVQKAKTSPRRLLLPKAAGASADSSEKGAMPWLHPQPPVTLQRREADTSAANNTTTPQRPTIHRGSISHVYALSEGLDDAVVTRQAPAAARPQLPGGQKK